MATAGAFLRSDKSTWTFQQYLQEYEKRWNIDRRRSLQLNEYQNRTLYTTWDLSYQRLQKEDPEAAQILKLLAYFDHQSIWFELFQARARDDLPHWLLTIARDSVEFDSVVRVLVEYCFTEVQSTTIRTFSIHTCIHDWTLVGLNQNVDSQSYWYAFDCIAKLISDKEWNTFGRIQYAQLILYAVRLTHVNFETLRQEIPFERTFEAESIVRLLKE